MVDNSNGSVTESGLTLDSMLLFIRGGSVFVRKDTARRSSKSMAYDPMTLVISLDAVGSAHGSLYVDDGDSFDYKEKNAFARIEFNATNQGTDNILNLSIKVVAGNADLLNENLLKVKQIVVVHSNGHLELPVDIYVGKSSAYEFNLTQ